jgi:hypothetical protein
MVSDIENHLILQYVNLIKIRSCTEKTPQISNLVHATHFWNVPSSDTLSKDWKAN